MNEIPDINRARQSVIIRCFRWLISVRILRRILPVVAGVITLIAIYYARVDWHSKAVWENCKRDLAAHGEVWQWSAFTPTPVPDEQNIFKAPQMAEWFGDNRGMFTMPIEQRITNAFAQRYANPDSIADIKTTAAAAAYVAWSDQFQGDFDTIAAALQRPSARIVADYSQPFSITLPNVASLYAVVKTLVQRAKCHLLLGQSEKAWQELGLLQEMRRLVECQGKFVTPEGDWMRRELARHSLQVIAKGLELREWKEPQLIALENQLGDSDFIALHAEALGCARALLLSSLEDGELLKAQAAALGDGFWARVTHHPVLMTLQAAPRGFAAEHATHLVQNFRAMITALSPTNGIVDPGAVSKAFAWWKKAQDGVPVLLHVQTLVNEAQIACALERYRIARGSYPDTPAELVPGFIEKLPRDLVNGEPLIYHRTDDGSFLLYSVGWNETDEGGKIVPTKGNPKNLTLGDWVWKNSLQPE